jgi:hypothetical protein
MNVALKKAEEQAENALTDLLDGEITGHKMVMSISIPSQ